MKIMVLSRGSIGPRMAAPGLRSYHLAGALGRVLPEAEVTLAVPWGKPPVQPPAPNVKMQEYIHNAHARYLAQDHDVAIARNFPPQFIRLMGGRTRLAVDAFTPFFIEWMELSRRDIQPGWRRTWMSGNRWYLNYQLTLADFIFCADQRQRDMWIGALMALALVPPATYQRDPSLRRLIDIVPFGVSQTPFTATTSRLRSEVPGIGQSGRIILWNGSIAEWYDPLTAIRAVERLLPGHPDIKLVFMGVRHPDAVTSPDAGVTKAAIDLASDLGLEGKSVFFLPGWIPYDEFDQFLAEAEFAICLGYETLESRFAFRTRYVELFRAGIPLLCTRGDVLAERVANDPLGIAVPQADLDAVVEAMERMLDDRQFMDTCRANLAAIGHELAWDTAIRPLADFCASGESYAMPANRRRLQALTRAGYYFAMKKICRSQGEAF